MYLDKTILFGHECYSMAVDVDGTPVSPFTHPRPGEYLKDRIMRSLQEGVSEAEVSTMYDEDSDDFNVDWRCNINTDPFDIAAAQIADHPRRVAEAMTASAEASSPVSGPDQDTAVSPPSGPDTLPDSTM